MRHSENLSGVQAGRSLVILALVAPLALISISYLAVWALGRVIPAVDRDPVFYLGIPFYLSPVVGAWLFWQSRVRWRAALLLPYLVVQAAGVFVLALFLSGWLLDLWL